MSIEPTPKKHHSVLQLHGGGSLVLAQLIKCAAIEEATGKRIPELFPSIIADSGGAIIACCLHSISARDLLKIFMKEIPDVLPDNRFLLKQPFPKMQKRFNPTRLRDALINVLGDKTLADINGNIFIRTHSIENKATRIGKVTSANGTIEYINATPDTKLINVVLKASAVPGIMPERDDEFMDPVADQNPFAIIYKLGKALPNTQFDFVQLGNIHNSNLPYLLRTRSFLRNLMTGAFQSYNAYHNQSAHLEDLEEILDRESITSLATFSSGRFSSVDNSAAQRTRLTVATLNDIATREAEYATLISKFTNSSETDTFANPDKFKNIIKELQTVLDPYMIRSRIVTDDPTSIPEQFPTPEIILVRNTQAYKSGYTLGRRIARHMPAIAKPLIKYNFDLKTAFESAGQKLLWGILPPIANDTGEKKTSSPATRSNEP